MQQSVNASSWTKVLLIVAGVFFFLEIAWATPASELEDKLKNNARDLKTREKLGEIYFSLKNYQKVISTLAPYSSEITSEALVNLANAYSGSQDSLNEIRTLQLFVDKDGQRFRPHYLLGLAFKNAKKWDDATKELRTSIQYAPGHRPSYNALLEIFAETKQNYESRTLLSDMVRNFGNKREFANLSCKLLAIDGFLAEALAACKKAIKQDPKHPDNHVYLAQTYYNQDKRDAAENIFRTVGRSYTKSEFVQYAVGEFYLHEKNFATAVRYLQTAVKLNPQAFRSQYTLGAVLFESNDHPTSLVHFDFACKLDKSNETTNALRNAASRMRKANQFSVAEGYEKKAAVCQQLSVR